MIKIKFIISILIFVSTVSMFAQQDTQYTQYMYNMNVLNPAYAGSRGVFSIGMLGRTQWVGVDGAPKTATFTMHSPVGDRVGLGLSIIHDVIGPVKESNIYGDFSYTIFTGEEGRLAFGLKAGITFLDVGSLLTVDPDPLNIPVHLTAPNFGAGMYYYTDKFYIGFSAPNFLETRHLENEAGYVSTASEKMHYFLTGGYVFDVSDNVQLKPSTMIKAAFGAPISVDLSANVLFNERLELGLSYRFDDSVSGIIGLQVSPDLRIGYAYDYTTSNFGAYNSGSHEIVLLFEFNRRNIKSPRFF